MAISHWARAWSARAWADLSALWKRAGDERQTLACAERAAALAESIVKENEYASKEAANRLGLGLIARLAGLHLRERLRAACERGVATDIAATLEATESIQRFEENVRGNVNPKLALAALTAEWTQAARRPAGAAR